MAPGDLTAYQFGFIIRKRIRLPEKDSLYFFVNGRYILKGDTLMSEVYQQRKDPDGFLYITYTDESTLGWMWNIKNEENADRAPDLIYSVELISVWQY